MKISFKDLLQLAKDHNQIWPSDLANDLEEEEPQVSLFSRLYSKLIAGHFQSKEKEEEEEAMYQPEPEKEPSFLPTLVVPGWDNPQLKGKNNWADFENLLLFYTIGKLAQANTPENQAQKDHDVSELREAIEALLPLKGQKKKSAEERLATDTTYLSFGKKEVDALLNNDIHAQYDLRREIQDAEETNSFNAAKLRKSETIATRVVRTLQQRYK